MYAGAASLLPSSCADFHAHIGGIFPHGSACKESQIQVPVPLQWKLVRSGILWVHHARAVPPMQVHASSSATFRGYLQLGARDGCHQCIHHQLITLAITSMSASIVSMSMSISIMGMRAAQHGSIAWHSTAHDRKAARASD